MKKILVMTLFFLIAAFVGNSLAYWVHPFYADVLTKDELGNVERFLTKIQYENLALRQLLMQRTPLQPGA